MNLNSTRTNYFEAQQKYTHTHTHRHTQLYENGMKWMNMKKIVYIIISIKICIDLEIGKKNNLYYFILFGMRWKSISMYR